MTTRKMFYICDEYNKIDFTLSKDDKYFQFYLQNKNNNKK